MVVSMSGRCRVLAGVVSWSAGPVWSGSRRFTPVLVLSGFVGVNRHLIQDEELGEVVTYTVPDAAELLGTTAKTLISRVQPTGEQRAELRGWAPKTAANPNRAWMIDANQVDALAGADVNLLQTQLAELREELERTRAQTEAELERLAVERAAAADAVATAEMERTAFRQATLDAAVARSAQLERERDQARAAVKTLTATVNALTD